MKNIELNGISIPIRKNIMSDHMLKKLKSGNYEVAEAREIPKITKSGDRVLEIGCAIGYVSSLLAQNENVSIVQSYDANPSMVEMAKEVASINGVSDKVSFTTALLSTDPHSPDQSDFYVHENFWASSLRYNENAKEVVKVDVIDANQIIRDLKPTLIVCDIEGAEYDLFKNLNLSGVERVFLEVHQKVLGRRGMLRLFDIFAARDFHYDQHHSHGGVILFSHVDRC